MIYAANSAATCTTTWQDPWPLWNGTSTAVTVPGPSITTYTTTSATTDMIWGGWVQSMRVDTNLTGTDTVTYVWRVWNDSTMATMSAGSTVGAAARRTAQAAIREPSPEELQARLRREQEYRAQADARLLQEKEAREKAEFLLRQFLTSEQIESLEKKQSFQLESISKDGSRKKYEIRRGFQGNVYLLGPDGQPVERYCIHPSMRVPDADCMLTQKLLLETNEELFLKTANRTRLR